VRSLKQSINIHTKTVYSVENTQNNKGVLVQSSDQVDNETQSSVVRQKLTFV